jgi:hypothetical protein
MISNIKKPSNKHSLARSIIALQNPKLEVFEVLSAEDVKTVYKALDRYSRQGSLSVIVIRS